MGEDGRGPGSAFLLTQLGTHAAADFAARIEELGLTPPLTGLLRAVAQGPGRSQQAIAEHLGTAPTRLVALVDALAAQGLVERRRNPDDRRLHALYLTDAGQAALAAIARVAREQNDALLGALDETERATLHDLLARVAAHRGLTPGVHPGYRSLGPDGTPPGREA